MYVKFHLELNYSEADYKLNFSESIHTKQGSLNKNKQNKVGHE